MSKPKLEEISDVLTPEGIADLDAKLKAGHKPVLMFEFESSPIHLRIEKISGGKVWARRTHLYTREEMKREVGIVDTNTGKKHRAIRTKKD